MAPLHTGGLSDVGMVCMPRTFPGAYGTQSKRIAVAGSSFFVERMTGCQGSPFEKKLKIHRPDRPTVHKGLRRRVSSWGKFGVKSFYFGWIFWIY
jgi:hypothetical protein